MLLGKVIKLAITAQSDFPEDAAVREPELAVRLAAEAARSGMDVPHFVGCVNHGDNLDPVVSAMASGNDFPIVIEQGFLAGCWSSPPSKIDAASCQAPASLPFPSRDES